MTITRRDFLKYCGMSAAALGLSASDMGMLENALANPNAPSVIWLQGSGCTGCSISLMNRISTSSPTTVDDLLLNSINLVYHPTLMTAAGDSAVSAAQAVYNAGNYILVVEGGVPTAFGGAACFAWTTNGQDVPLMDAVKTYAAKASKIVCVGTCASWGGMPTMGSNPAGIVGVKSLTGKTTINVAGCPANPDWTVWAIVQILLNKAITLDSSGRPTALYGSSVHSQCPRRGTSPATTFAQDGRCLKGLGCRGPSTSANCPANRWNNGVNWCVGANAPCIGCTSPDFPTSNPFYK